MSMLLTSCLALGRASGSPFATNQETHKPEQNPGHLSRSAFCSASLRFTTTTTTTTTYGHRVPTELFPTGPVVFCGSASHSLPLFVCNMITHRHWCFASWLTTKIHHRQTLAPPHEPSILCCLAHMRVMRLCDYCILWVSYYCIYSYVRIISASGRRAG